MDGEIAFQPLARIDREGYRTWAAEWIEGRLRHEGVAVGPDEKAAIWSALGSLAGAPVEQRSEEHTSGLQSPCNLVCRLLLEKKKKKKMRSLADRTRNVSVETLRCGSLTMR